MRLRPGSAVPVARGRRRRIAGWLSAAVAVAAVGFGLYVAGPAAAAPSQWLQVSAGPTHTCGIKADNTLWCWGANDFGQLGTGDNTARTVPARVGSNAGWTSVSAGDGFTCGVQSGYRYCWGANAVGQLGLGDYTDRNAPRRNTGESNNWATVTAGTGHVCGLRTSGLAQCWGLNSFGQLGLNDTTNRNLPRTVSGGHTWSVISAGAFHTCGLDTDGVRFCWGANHHYELGLPGDQEQRLVPTSHGNEGTWQSIDAGDRTSCGVSSGRRVYCWGQNTYGHAGSGNTLPQDEPVQVMTSAAAVSSGGLHACLVRTNGNLYCWGGNEAGRLGDGTTTNRYTPVSVSSQAPLWSSVSAGSGHTCGIRVDGTLYCWGYNATGQLGDGTQTPRLTPVLVA
mgnify:CR=1 FL=1